MTQETKEFLDNQIHGGAIVSENVRAVFRAIGEKAEPPWIKRNTGETQVFILLKSLPSDEEQSIMSKIEAVKKPYDLKLIELEKEGRPSRESERNAIDDLKRYIKQQRSLVQTQIVIDYLKSINQWWAKRQSVPISIVATEDLNIQDEEHFTPPI